MADTVENALGTRTAVLMVSPSFLPDLIPLLKFAGVQVCGSVANPAHNPCVGLIVAGKVLPEADQIEVIFRTETAGNEAKITIEFVPSAFVEPGPASVDERIKDLVEQNVAEAFRQWGDRIANRYTSRRG